MTFVSGVLPVLLATTVYATVWPGFTTEPEAGLEDFATTSFGLWAVLVTAQFTSSPIWTMTSTPAPLFTEVIWLSGTAAPLRVHFHDFV